jgi:AcrR family transcriptional regulator
VAASGRGASVRFRTVRAVSYTSRRRGELLEHAIFQAVWDELNEVTYPKLTMDAIAARAQTSKPVLYRRWPGRAELVLAALAYRSPDDDALPDTGDLRTDLVEALNQLVRRLEGVPGNALHGLLAETLRDPELRPRFQAQVAARETMLMPILLRAVERGEITGDGLTTRIVTLPLDLLRNEYLLHGLPFGATIVQEIIDDVAMPLLRTL